MIQTYLAFLYMLNLLHVDVVIAMVDSEEDRHNHETLHTQLLNMFLVDE